MDLYNVLHTCDVIESVEGIAVAPRFLDPINFRDCNTNAIFAEGCSTDARE